MSIKVTNEIKPLYVDSKEVVVGDDTVLLVKSDWNNNRLVHLEIGNKKVAVVASDLQAAITNSTNTSKF